MQKTIPRQGHPDGITCQTWSHQVPQTHTRSRVNFPDAGLGGHNACRNPDGNVRAWCFTANAEVRWDYCDIGTPQLAGRDDSPGEMSRGEKMGGGAKSSTRAMRHDDNEGAPAIALVVTSISKKGDEDELDAPVGPEAEAPAYA